MNFVSLTEFSKLTGMDQIRCKWAKIGDLALDNAGTLWQCQQARDNFCAVLDIAVSPLSKSIIDPKEIDLIITEGSTATVSCAGYTRNIINLNCRDISSESSDFMRFAIAHELGHIANGDDCENVLEEQAQLHSLQFAPNESHYSREDHERLAAKSQLREYAADLTALRFFDTFEKGLAAATAVFMKDIDEEERLVSTTAIASHPLSYKRLALLKTAAPK